jgi:hypothetical protein
LRQRIWSQTGGKVVIPVFEREGVNVDEIRTAVSWGILDGVTTNPTHIAKSRRPFEELLYEIFSIVEGLSASRPSPSTPRALFARARHRPLSP